MSNTEKAVDRRVATPANNQRLMTDGGEETYRIIHPSTGKPLPPKPEYATDADRRIDAALVELFEAATDAEDDFYRQIAASELGSHRLDQKLFATDGGVSTHQHDGPRENPHDDAYHWWKDGDELVEAGQYSNRSVAIRQALGDLTDDHGVTAVVDGDVDGSGVRRVRVQTDSGGTQ